MMRRARAAAALLAAIGLAAAAPPPCPPTGVNVEASPLPALAAALRPGGTLNMLAVGSTTIFAPMPSSRADTGHKLAPGAPTPTASPAGFVAQAAHALEASVRGLRVSLTLRGGRGLTAVEMADEIRSELAHGRYQLVLWQTGTIDAVDEVAPGEFYQTLSDGAAAVTAAGADLVLIDPQYSRFLEANANLEPYLSTLQGLAALPGVTLFPRYALMRDWASGGQIDLEATAKADRPAVAARLHLCLGRALARMLLQDTK